MLRLCQIAKIVQCVAPVDINGGAVQAANVNMAKYDHVSFIIGIGNLAADTIITMNSGNTSLAAGTVMGFSYYESTTHAALVSVVDSAALTTVGVGGYTPANAADDNICIVVEVDASEVLAMSAARQYVGMRFSNPGAACLISCVAVCQVNRYQSDPNFMPNPIAA